MDRNEILEYFERKGEAIEEMSLKEQIETILRWTDRKGIDKLLKFMDKAGFYSAPASGKYHGAYEGALAEHSMNVYNLAIDLASVWLGEEWLYHNESSIAIAAFLHDLGKVGQFGKPLYVENILKTGQSRTQPFKHNEDLITLDHEIVSVIEASKFIELTEEEQFAIAYHNGLYTNIGRYGLQGKERPLQMIIHFADLWASRVVEQKGVNNE